MVGIFICLLVWCLHDSTVSSVCSVQLKELNIPVDSSLAAGLMDSNDARLDEHKQMKELVLNWERRQEEEAYQGD